MNTLSDFGVDFKLSPTFLTACSLHFLLVGLALGQIFRVKFNKIVRNTHFLFVGLTFPEVSGSSIQDGGRNTQMATQSKYFTLVQVSDQLNIDHTITSLAEITKITILIIVASAHHHTRQTTLGNQLSGIISHRCSLVRAQLTLGEGVSVNTHSLIDEGGQIVMNLRLIYRHNRGECVQSQSSLPDRISGVNGLCDTKHLLDGRVLLFLCVCTQGKNDSTIYTSTNRHNASTKATLAHVVIEHCGLFFQPLLHVEVSLRTDLLEGVLEVSVHVGAGRVMSVPPC